MLKTRFSLAKWLIPFAALALSACTSLPNEVTTVKNFDVNRYLGTWYEIARLDHSFERGLSQVTATYSLRDDGGIRVLNRGYSEEDQEWSEAEGKAYFVDESSSGHLKVSFFGPFYGAYGIFKLDAEDYQHAFVSGPSHKYLWLLSRTPTVSPSVMDDFITTSNALGFDTTSLIMVSH